MTTSPEPIRLGVLIGGGGRTLINLADRIDAGDLSARIALVIATKEKLRGVERARERGLPVVTLGSLPDADQAIYRMLDEHSVDLACLAGYMRYLPIPSEWRNRVLNIHPALLPSFGGKGMYGMRVHRAVINRGCRVSGCTVHLVNDEYDAGPILVQKTCRVPENNDPDDLAARVFELECEAYPEAIKLMLAGEALGG